MVFFILLLLPRSLSATDCKIILSFNKRKRPSKDQYAMRLSRNFKRIYRETSRNTVPYVWSGTVLFLLPRWIPIRLHQKKAQLSPHRNSRHVDHHRGDGLAG
mmetsp:Transcript_29796/g.68382  ORF Transcript_29796/g.68382 Transcript_29796/m.68382 type:complete len:102 (-) Transcript_29796:1510-1815(-)